MKIQDLRRRPAVRPAAPAVALLASVSLGGSAPLPVMCCVLPNGDVLIPTGNDTWLPGKRTSSARLEFHARDEGRRTPWSVTRLGRAARFAASNDTGWHTPATGPLAHSAAFTNGVRVRVGASAMVRTL